MNAEKFAFQAETKELMNLMIHSLYSNKEIFLRELISNASDAIDKLKFESIKNASLSQNGDFEIFIDVDKEKNTLTLKDNGIGMSRDDVINNLGTIAKSGTKEFLKMAQEAQSNPELIGQFGVGFYSAFMVAHKVQVHTQKAGTEQGILWTSEGDGEYEIKEVPRPGGTGTTLTLHLNKAEEGDEAFKDFTDQWTLQSTVKKYSDFIAYPIKMEIEKQEPIEGKDPVEYETIKSIETLNSQKALWLKSPSEVTEEEHKEFYRHISNDWSDPLKHIHFKAEGTMEFSSLMYIPKTKPWNFHYRDQEYGLQLYVKRVFIMDHCSDLLPPYLRFVKGLVDSSDLSLNVSREILQKDRQILAIQKSLVNKVLSQLKDLLNKDRTSYENFWNEFGMSLKEGIPSGDKHKDKVKDLLLFRSTAGDALVSLNEYVERMKEDQKSIFYITGESLDQIKNSPYLESLKEKNYEVLLMTDPIDDWVADHMGDFKDLKFQSITKEDLDLDSEEEKKAKEEQRKSDEEKFEPLIAKLKTSLDSFIKEVKISSRLKDSPVCLVSGKNDPSAHMEKILSQMGNEGLPKSKRILEINPSHPLIIKMLGLPESKQEHWGEILYYEALLNEGSQIPEPQQFTQKLNQLMMDT